MVSDPQQQPPIIAHGTNDPTAGPQADRTVLIFEVAAALDNLDLAAWTHPMLTFFDTYNGIELYASDDDPIPAALSLLSSYQAGAHAVTSAQLAKDLCSLEVVLYHAAWFNAGTETAIEIWNPLCLPFRNFISLKVPGGEWRLWKAGSANPDWDEVHRHLLANYVRVNGFT